MNIILAMSPLESNGLLELTLDAAFVQFQYLQNIRSLKQLEIMDAMILDPDQPGPDFLRTYRKLHASIGYIPLIVLGQPDHVTMKMMPWDKERTVFLHGNHILERLEVIVNPQARNVYFPHTQPNPQAPALPAATATATAKVKTTTQTYHSEQDSQKLFQGLHSIQLADILQMLCLSNWSGEVRVSSKANLSSGVVHIVKGNIIHATAGPLQALEACYTMLSWANCEFYFLEHAVDAPITINIGWEAILLQAAQRIDELGLAEKVQFPVL
jgi:hypothetical protein